MNDLYPQGRTFVPTRTNVVQNYVVWIKHQFHWRWYMWCLPTRFYINATQILWICSPLMFQKFQTTFPLQLSVRWCMWVDVLICKPIACAIVISNTICLQAQTCRQRWLGRFCSSPFSTSLKATHNHRLSTDNSCHPKSSGGRILRSHREMFVCRWILGEDCFLISAPAG